MMVNANLMLLVVMLWAGTLPVASPKHHPYMPKTFWEKLGCDKYILPIHAIWITRASCGDNKRYTCQAGYNSQVQTTCKNGEWILEQTCHAVECPPGVIITNSDDVTESRIFDTEYNFDCKTGYTMNGETGTLTCGENGTWLELKTCQAVECPPGVIITNSYNKTVSKKIGEDFDFPCSTGIPLTNTLTCGENGTWKYQKGAACPHAIIWGTGIKSELDAISSSNCDEACANDTKCGFVQRLANGICNIYYKPTIYVNPASSIFQCIQKCKDDPRCLTAWYITASCYLFSDQFSNLRCDKYILPIHAIWITRASCGDNKRYTCQAGYNSQVQSTCKNGEWILEPTCHASAVECPPGVNITNSDDVTESRIFDTEYNFDCKTGYTMNGETGTLTCGENGTWLEQKTCQAVECPPGVNITNSYDVTEYRIFDTEYNFDCKTGYTMNGETGTLTCGENGTWLELKTCQAVECPPGVIITNSYNKTVSKKIGEDFDFPCSTGIPLTNTLTCGENGTWKYQKGAACPRAIRQMIGIRHESETISSPNCDEACANVTRCGFVQQVVTGRCKLFYKPTIYLIPAPSSIFQCIQKCKDDPRCLTAWYITASCYLFSDQFSNLNEVFLHIFAEKTYKTA